MDIQELINSYTQWLNTEIDFEKVGEYYEISTPFLDSQNDYIQFYVRLDGDNIHFTDDGFTLERLLLSGFKFNTNKRKMLNNLLQRYGVELYDNELITTASVKNFPQKKHMYIQAIMKIDDLFINVHNKITSNFTSDILKFFEENDIYYSDNVQFTGLSGFSHNYDFLIQRTKNKPERLCRIMNSPTKNNMGNILFAWNDTKPSRRSDSKLVVFINDKNPIAKGVEEAFVNYDTKVVKWSQRASYSNLDFLIS